MGIVVEVISPNDFLARVKPSLEAQDWDGLLRTVRKHWTPHEVKTLLTCNHADARKVAALAIGLVGKDDALEPLSKVLHDGDRMVVEMAEHAMWQIWFRGGTEAANAHLARGAEALNRHDIEEALQHLEKAIKLSPDFWEAYNQRAIAHYLAERFPESIDDCHRVIRAMPLHFGAWAGLGHSYLALGNVSEALKAYEKAIEINPHLECIDELVQELRGEGGLDA